MLDSVYEQCVEQYQQLVADLLKLGVYGAKSGDEVYHKIRHVNAFSNIREVEEGSMWDFEYKNLSVTLSWDDCEGARLSNYVEFWVNDEEEPHTFDLENM